jgi:hypothetical protein
MGARVYNPLTNQFTSPDPVTGGNETSYTYPNDPINKTDFDGLSVLSDLAFSVGAAALTALACAATAGVGCIIATLAISATSGFLAKGVEWHEKKNRKESQFDYMLSGARSGLIDGFLGRGVGSFLGKTLIKAGARKLPRQSMAAVRRSLYLYGPSEALTQALRAGSDRLLAYLKPKKK